MIKCQKEMWDGLRSLWTKETEEKGEKEEEINFRVVF